MPLGEYTEQCLVPGSVPPGSDLLKAAWTTSFKALGVQTMTVISPARMAEIVILIGAH